MLPQSSDAAGSRCPESFAWRLRRGVGRAVVLVMLPILLSVFWVVWLAANATTAQATDDDAAAVVGFVDMNYPHDALQAEVQGAVVVVVKLDSDGHVVEAKAESGPRLLVPAALASVRGWTFASGSSRGVVIYDFDIDACPSGSAGLFRMYAPNLARITACALGGLKPAPARRGESPVLASPELRYPLLAGSAGVEGAVVVALDVRPSGDVRTANALAGPAALRRDAVANALTWKFKPGDGRHTVLVYDFRIEGRCHDVRGSLFTLRHANVASIVKCGPLPLPSEAFDEGMLPLGRAR